MSREEVEQLLKDHYPAGGKRQAPTRVTDDANELFLFMNPEHSKEPNGEGISIRFADGKVVGKSYSMD